MKTKSPHDVLSKRLTAIFTCLGVLFFVLTELQCFGQAFSCNCLMEEKSSAGSFNKVGFEQFECGDPFPAMPKFYLVSNYVITGNDPYGYTLSYTMVYTTDPSAAVYSEGAWGAPQPYVCSGGGKAPDCSFSYNSDASASDNDCYAEVWAAFAWVNDDPYLDISCTATESDSFFTDGEATCEYKDTYSSEFDDQAMIGQMKAHITPYPDDWTTGTDGQASFSLDSGDFSVSGSKLKYRLKVPAPSEPKATYICKWQEVTTTTTSSGTTITSEDKSETITGTGDPVNPAYGSEHEVQMPSGGPGTTITIQEQSPSVEKVQSSGNSGDGGPGAS